MRLCILKCVMARVPKETELDDIARVMRTSLKLRALCKKYQKMNESGNKIGKDKIKKWMIPAFVPSSLLYAGKAQRYIIGLTNLCYMDIDQISKSQIKKAMDYLRQDEHVVLALRSMSGKGLHFLIKYRFKDMEQPQITAMSAKRMAMTYSAVFNTLSTHYANLLHLSIDESGRNAAQSCNISYDEDLYYNPNALPYTLIYKHQKVGKKQSVLQME